MLKRLSFLELVSFMKPVRIPSPKGEGSRPKARFMKWLVVLTALLLPLIASASGPRSQATVVKVIDGDTVRVLIDGHQEPLRLIGIDAPESSINERALGQAKRNHLSVEKMVAAGHKAAHFLEQRVQPGTILSLEYDVTQRDKYNRILAYAYLPDGTMVNKVIVHEGFAYPLTIPPNVRYSDEFLKIFQKARAAKVGLWATLTEGDYRPKSAQAKTRKHSAVIH